MERTFDKYGRLTKTDGIIENVYEFIPQFDANGNLITNSANGSAVLATSKDLTNNQTTEYHYNAENGIFEGVVIRDSNGDPIKMEGYGYDNANRLTQSACFWDWNAGKVVASQITYVKADTDPLADSKINDFMYIVGEASDLLGTPSATTTNTYEDPHGRLTKKSYLIGNKTFLRPLFLILFNFF